MFYMHRFLFVTAFLSILLACLSCRQRADGSRVPPWGTAATDTVGKGGGFTLSDIVSNGEIIMLTIYGADTYYDYRGQGAGTQYMLCGKFAQSIGVSLRVLVCRDTAEVIRRLENGEGDVAALMIPRAMAACGGLLSCGASVDSLGVQWAVRGGNGSLASAMDAWYEPRMLDAVRAAAARPRVRRRVYAPYANRSAGIISKYDNLFRKYAPVVRWDWRLLAAQCYQESCFDPEARSWAGACGLMQIMPATADHLDLQRARLFVPEDNIAAAAKYIKELSSTFNDIRDADERRNFVLAAYNGGTNHVRDAMALTAKHGGDTRRWRDVSRYMLLLQRPEYYNDPVVLHGYARGSETVEYVSRIRQLYAQYRGAPSPPQQGGASGVVEPRRATKKHRFSHD